MQLLFPTVNNQSERIFYLTQLEILALCAPLVNAIVQAQEAIVRNQLPTLKNILADITKRIQYISKKSLLNIDPNRFSKNYVNHVVWAKTVAPFAVPFTPGVLGPSGTSSPIFNVLDAFLGRPTHKSFLGKEIYQLRNTYPVFWQNFIKAVEQVSLKEYMQQANDPTLQYLVNQLLEEYAGKDGFLGRHRMKVYGYLEIAFKVGRDITIGGFSGKVTDKEHVHVDQQLEKARIERFKSQARNFHFAYIKHIGHTHSGGSTQTKHVVLDVAGLGIRYQPGYRCKILPEQEHTLIKKTIAALNAKQDHQVELTEAWIAAISLRYGYSNAKSLSLYNFLRFAKIRVLSAEVEHYLLRISKSHELRQAIHNDRALEVHEAFNLLQEKGIDIKEKMLNVPTTDPWHIAHVLPPEDFRTYTISSSMQPFGNKDSADELHLSVGVLNYQRQQEQRFGTASGFLARSAGRKEPVTIRIESPPRFSLPDDPQCPLLMIAGGTGVGVFRSFIAERLADSQCGEMVLIFFTQSRSCFYYQEDFLHAVASEKLKIYVQFSKEELVLDLSQGIKDGFKYRQSRAQRADRFFQEPEHAKLLWKFIQYPQKRIYLCGRTSFAKSVQESMLKIIEQNSNVSPQQRKQFAVQTMGRMYAENSIMQETYTNISVQPKEPSIKLSQVTRKNRDDGDLWFIINDGIYDVTDFQHLHPGGDTILRSYAGMDASEGYTSAHDRPDVDVMRDIYRIGKLVLPDFGNDDKLQSIFKVWQRQLNEITEMQNCLATDLSLKMYSVIGTFDAHQQSLYKTEKILYTHKLFQISYFTSLVETIIPALFSAVNQLVDQDTSTSNVDSLLQSLTDPREMIDSVAIIQEAIDDLVAREDDKKLKQRITDTLLDICSVDTDVLDRVKDKVVAGIEIFEEHDSAVYAQHQSLEHLLYSAVMVMKQYWDKITKCFDDHSWSLEIKGEHRR